MDGVHVTFKTIEYKTTLIHQMTSKNLCNPLIYKDYLTTKLLQDHGVPLENPWLTH